MARSVYMCAQPELTLAECSDCDEVKTTLADATTKTLISLTSENTNVWEDQGFINVYKQGNIVELKMQPYIKTEVTSRTVIAILPEGFRPPAETYGGQPEYNLLSVIVRGNGEIAIDPTTAGQKYETLVFPAWN